MALELFDFPYHRVETENPESGTRIQLGGSYVFTAPPSDPDQRIFTLTFPLMKFFTDADGLIDADISTQYNMKKLIDFYHEHKLYKTFQYQHPVHGLLEVQFYKPLKEPEGIPNGNGVTKEFSIQLLEIP